MSGIAPRGSLVEADLTWLRGSFHSQIQVEIRPDGRIGGIGKLGCEPTLRLEKQALLPGMVNAHSHTFQRGLRGYTEIFPERSGNFWSWRHGMYQLAARLDAEQYREVCRECFQEMLRAGITSVGEFHYLHHESSGDYGLDDLVLSAAAETGIRLVLLNVCYLTGGLGTPLAPAQRRFAAESTAHFLEQTDALQPKLDTATQSLGLAAHSVRAVPIEDIVRLHRRAKDDGLVFHMHIEEQQQEIKRSVSHYGQRPMELLLDRLEIGSEFTAVHATQTVAEDLHRFIKAGGNVCLCPLTEANLADGTPEGSSLRKFGANLCLGTDANLRIDFNEEMRLLEYAQRLKLGQRGVFRGRGGSVAEGLWQIASEGGARALGLNAGRIETGYLADFITVDLDHPILVGTEPATLLSVFIFSCDSRALKHVCVGGRWIL